MAPGTPTRSLVELISNTVRRNPSEIYLWFPGGGKAYETALLGGTHLDPLVPELNQHPKLGSSKAGRPTERVETSCQGGP